MKRLHVFLLLLLVGLVILTLGFPHQDEGWFESFFPVQGKEKFQHILLTEFRIPRLVIALVAGASLSVCGLLLQTLLNNPLAGPSILGLTSGAHLFVALTIPCRRISFWNVVGFEYHGCFCRRFIVVRVDYFSHGKSLEIASVALVSRDDAGNVCFCCYRNFAFQI